MGNRLHRAWSCSMLAGASMAVSTIVSPVDAVGQTVRDRPATTAMMKAEAEGLSFELSACKGAAMSVRCDLFVVSKAVDRYARVDCGSGLTKAIDEAGAA